MWERMKIENKREFGRNQAYQLVAVTDANGVDKVHTRRLYKDRINCIAIDFHYDERPVYEDKYRMNMTFVQTERGLWCKRRLHTSIVLQVEETEKGVKIHTYNSIYVFEKAKLRKVPYQDTADLIELYLSLEDNDYFGKGFYYDANKQPHELREYVHVGMFQDSVLVGFVPEDELRGYVCRYFPNEQVEFYSTLYGQQDYSTPMLIHNTGKDDLIVRFQMYPHAWTISPGESKYIKPFEPDGADGIE